MTYVMSISGDLEGRCHSNTPIRRGMQLRQPALTWRVELHKHVLFSSHILHIKEKETEMGMKSANLVALVTLWSKCASNPFAVSYLVKIVVVQHYDIALSQRYGQKD